MLISFAVRVQYYCKINVDSREANFTLREIYNYTRAVLQQCLVVPGALLLFWGDQRILVFWFIEIICRAPWISQHQSTGLPYLRTHPWYMYMSPKIINKKFLLHLSPGCPARQQTQPQTQFQCRPAQAVQ